MENIISHIVSLLQNSQEGKQVQQETNLSHDQIAEVAKVALPTIAAKVKDSPELLTSIVAIFNKNKFDQDSLMNAQPDFKGEKAVSEGNHVLSSVLGSEKQQVADQVAAETGLHSSQVNTALPMIAALATKVLGLKIAGPAQNPTQNNVASSQTPGAERFGSFEQILGFLDTNHDGSVSATELMQAGQQVFNRLVSQNDSVMDEQRKKA